MKIKMITLPKGRVIFTGSDSPFGLSLTEISLIVERSLELKRDLTKLSLFLKEHGYELIL
jgi:hypothetical protein